MMEPCGPTIIQVNDSLSRPTSASSIRSVHEVQQLSASQLDPLSNVVTRVDLGTRSSSADAHHGTPRAVKYRNKVNK
ncbi:unnamed protein product [Brugia pahangi]|uniref:Uncharacterized protein n=1 Tax=Brugia pahangi TaxID=6280 RepID=A0A0N4TAE0_BRUPA|nr:unnamed protein product [Brugia pahangi]